MESVNIRKLKHETNRMIERVALGETIEVFRRNELVAVLGPATCADSVERPDFRARLKGIYGERCLTRTGTEVLAEERSDR